MITTFEYNLSTKETMLFENLFEEELALEEKEKEDLLNKAYATWMFIDGKIAGETYGIKLNELDEEVEDTYGEDPETIYCYSTALLSSYQGKGLSKILKSHWLGTMIGHTDTIVGHATTEVAVKLNRFFGAEFGATHENWYGTSRKSTYYRIKL